MLSGCAVGVYRLQTPAEKQKWLRRSCSPEFRRHFCLDFVPEQQCPQIPVRGCQMRMQGWPGALIRGLQQL